MNLRDEFRNYRSMYELGMSKLDLEALEIAIRRIKLAAKVFVGGNGGSAAISNHLCCDFMKGAKVQTISLSSNTPLLTAIANDLGYENTLSFQLEKHLTGDPSEIVMLVSSSGDSPNIIKAAEYASTRGAHLIGLTGFTGGRLMQIAHTKLHIPIHNYGVVEDCHQGIMHIISQYIAKGG